MAPDAHVPPSLHALEAEVMQAAWTRGESSVREVMEDLNVRTSKPRAFTTYMTIMARLHGKGLLERTRQGKIDFYRPAYTQDAYANLRAQGEVDSLVDKFGDVALGTSPDRWLK